MAKMTNCKIFLSTMTKFPMSMNTHLAEGETMMIQIEIERNLKKIENDKRKDSKEWENKSKNLTKAILMYCSKRNFKAVDLVDSRKRRKLKRETTPTSKRNKSKKSMISSKEMKKSSVKVLEATEKNHKSIQDSMRLLKIKRVKFSSLKMRKDFSESNKIRISSPWIFLKDIIINSETMLSLIISLLNNLWRYSNKKIEMHKLSGYMLKEDSKMVMKDRSSKKSE